MLVKLQSTVALKDGKGHRCLGIFVPNTSKTDVIDLALLDIKPHNGGRPLSMKEKVESLLSDRARSRVVIEAMDEEARAAFPDVAPAQPTVADQYAAKMGAPANAEMLALKQELAILRGTVDSFSGARASSEQARAELEEMTKSLNAQRDSTTEQLKAAGEALKAMGSQMAELIEQVATLSKKLKVQASVKSKSEEQSPTTPPGTTPAP